MRRSKHRKPPSLHLKISPTETSPRCSSVLSDWDADDEGMSSGDFLPSRPLSLSIPAGPYCPRRPTLQEILSNTAPPPWTLSAFTAYLSQNHCFETLEFTMDAKRYENRYHEMIQKYPHGLGSLASQECEYVRMLWQKLLDAYIVPNGPREVNLPSDVRDHLVNLPCIDTPPDPSELDCAVKIIYELMDESVLVPFLNSLAPSRGHESHSSPWTSNESMVDTYMPGSLDERSISPSKSRRSGSPPNAGPGSDIVSQSYSGPSPRHSHQSHLTAALGRSASRLSTYVSGTSGNSKEIPDNLTDDSTDSPSPSDSALEPMTPPNTPPTSSIPFHDISPGTSPQIPRDGGNSSWKKMSAKLGWKKSRSGHGSGSSTSSTRYPIVRETSEESGETSLKLSEGSGSPLLEAHPGSPVNISGRRPSLTAHLGIGKDCTAIKRDGVAAKNLKNHGRSMTLPHNILPQKVPQTDTISIRMEEGRDDQLSIDTSVCSTAMDFIFEEDKDNGLWISATPSHISLSSTATTTLDSTLLALDTNVASCDTSIHSAASTSTSDIYGWEEELERKTSIEQHAESFPWEREQFRRAPTIARSMGRRVRKSGRDFEGKRKSLLYRVLNISGRRSDEDMPKTMLTNVLSKSPIETRHCLSERTSA